MDTNIISESDSQAIGKMIADTVGTELRNVSQASIIELNNCFKELEDMLVFERKQENLLNGFSPSRGWAEYLYSLKNGQTYAKLFRICVRILELIRNDSLEDGYDLIVYSTLKGGGLHIYLGNESKISKLRHSKSSSSIKYAMTKLEKMVNVEQNTLFAQHYNKFLTIANDHKSKYGGTVNRGHMTEAFQRHLYYQHNIKKIDEEVILNFSETEEIDVRTVMINLYYSINSEGWFTGGDVGSLQVKGNNQKLASIKSIRAVASTLLEIYKNRENFNVETFKQLFTQGDYDKMTKQDPEELCQKPLEEIESMIGAKTKS